MCHDFKLHKIFRLSMESVCIFKCVSDILVKTMLDRALKKCMLPLQKASTSPLVVAQSKWIKYANCKVIRMICRSAWDIFTFFRRRQKFLKLEVCHHRWHAKTHFVDEIDASGLFLLLYRNNYGHPMRCCPSTSIKHSRQFIKVYCKIDSCNNDFLLLAATAAYK
jgi:hypothetical protein